MVGRYLMVSSLKQIESFLMALSMAIFLSIFQIVFGNGFANASSFDCTKASTETEIAICANPNLTELDSQLGRLWRDSEGSTLRKAEQKQWIMDRDKCIDDHHCISAKYSVRLAELATGCTANIYQFIGPNVENSNQEPDLQEFLELSNEFEQCISKSLWDEKGDFKSIAKKLRYLPLQSCVLNIDFWILDVPYRTAYMLYQRCDAELLRRLEMLLEAMNEIIIHQRPDVRETLSKSHSAWLDWQKNSCSLFETYSATFISEDIINRCKRVQIENRLLMLSPWISTTDVIFGEWATDMEELLGVRASNIQK